MEPDYKGFVLHIREWDAHGIPWGSRELVELAKKYNTPIKICKSRHTRTCDICIENRDGEDRIINGCFEFGEGI